MKKLTAIIAVLFLVLSGITAAPRTSPPSVTSLDAAMQFMGASTAQATALGDKLLELFRSDDPEVSLGAMLLATGARDEGRKLEQYVRDSLKAQEQTALERTVKLYFLAHSTYSDEDMLAFVQGFPEEAQDFLAVLQFDSKISQTVSGLMVQDLSAWTSCQTRLEVREAARAKVLRLHNTQDESGWAAEMFPYPQELQQCE